MEHKPIQPDLDRSLRPFRDALTERQRQMDEFGHTPERDLAEYHDNPHNRARLARIMRMKSCDAVEDMQFNKLELARRHALQAIATGFALVELIDNLTGSEDG